MDRPHKDALAAADGRARPRGRGGDRGHPRHRVRGRAGDRVVLMGQGTVIGDGPPAEVLAGGWHFSTDVARTLDGAALTPAQGAAALTTGSARARAGAGAMSWQAASFGILALVLAGAFLWYERQRPPARVLALVAALAALAVVGRARVRRGPERQADDRHRAVRRLRARRRARLRRRRDHRARVERLLLAGPVDGLADGRLGRRSASAGRCWPALTRGRELSRIQLALVCGVGRRGLRRLDGLSTSGRWPRDRTLRRMLRSPARRCPTTSPTCLATSASAS